nr:caspase [Polypodium hydriforme]
MSKHVISIGCQCRFRGAEGSIRLPFDLIYPLLACLSNVCRVRVVEPISELGTKPKQGQPYRPVFDHRDVDTMYAIRNLPPRGLCLIVNNYDFPGSSLSKRKGAEKDKQPLLDLFDCLGFEVMYKQNLPAVDVVEAVQELVGRSRGHDCAVVFLMSHGKEGAVFGADARPVYMSNIIGILSTALSPGKPKLLIVQACRVVEDQPAGVGPSHDPHWQDTHLESRPTAPSYQFADGVEADSQNSSQYQVSQSISRQSSSMQFADMLMAFSTLPGTPSFRNEGTGSWFVQALVEVFHKYAHSEDLIRLFVRINMAVATRLSQNGEPQQVPAPMLTLTKLLYLRPIKPFYS